MTIDPETLAAYADGELNPIEAARVERAVADDPALAAQLAAHRALADTLTRHYAPIAAQSVPDRLTALLTRDANVIDLAQARAARTAAPSRYRIPVWAAGGAMAASLIVGLGLGMRIPDGAPMTMRGGTLVAQGNLNRALDTQLASVRGEGGVRILLSFRQADGSVCRGFEGQGAAGIACRSGGEWVLRRVQSAAPEANRAYRQAGSAEVLAAAQDMAAGGALDAAAEQAARDGGWKPVPVTR